MSDKTRESSVTRSKFLPNKLKRLEGPDDPLWRFSEDHFDTDRKLKRGNDKWPRASSPLRSSQSYARQASILRDGLSTPQGSRGRPYVFEEDSVPSHIAHVTGE